MAEHAKTPGIPGVFVEKLLGTWTRTKNNCAAVETSLRGYVK
jgi:hypothetical protein